MAEGNEFIKGESVGEPYGADRARPGHNTDASMRLEGTSSPRHKFFNGAADEWEAVRKFKLLVRLGADADIRPERDRSPSRKPSKQSASLWY